MNPASTDRVAREYNVCLLGASLDTGNQGCSALAVSLVKLLIDSEPNCRINLLYSSRKGGVQSLRVAGRTVKVNVVNCRLSPKSRINEHLFWIFFLACIQRIVRVKSIRDKIVWSNKCLKTLEHAHFVGEIRGGDSFSDIYGLRRFLFGITPCVIAILMRKELVLLPQTYGPFNSPLAKHIARFVMMRASRLYSRDENSLKVIRNLLGEKGKHKTIQFCPDVAFVLEPTLPERPDIQPKLDRNNSAPLIGLNISDLLYRLARKNRFGLKFDYKRFIPLLLQRLIEQTNAHVLLVPHVTQPGTEAGEVGISREVLRSMNQKYSRRLHLLAQQYDQSQVKGIIGLCDFFIGSRLHACIAALSQCIPAVGLAYSKKFHGVFQSVGTERFAVDMRQKGSEEIIETVMSAFEQRKAIAESLAEVVPGVKKNVSDVFKDMLRA